MTGAAERLATLEPRCTTAESLAFFDALPTVAAAAIRGEWSRRELETGHPWDGLLTASGWYGKRFDGTEAVHPLLFRTTSGTVFPVPRALRCMGTRFRSPRGPASSTTQSRSPKAKRCATTTTRSPRG